MVIDNETKERLLYLLDHLDSFIEDEVYQVISDSTDDPHHSAVTLCNLISSYLFVMKSLSNEQVLPNITEYLADKCFTDDEIKSIYDRRDVELRLYVGKIFE